MFNPKILAFCCYGSGRYLVEGIKNRYRNLEIVEVPCAGRIETYALVEALNMGADGVFIIACHEGNCEHLIGNIRAKKKVEYLMEILTKIGVEKERFSFFNTAANAEALLWKEMQVKIERLRSLGPNITQGERK